MRNLKNGLIIVFLALVLVFTAIMVFPVDTFIAKQASHMKGYEIKTDFESNDFGVYYDRLGENEKLAYAIIYAEIRDFPETILVPDLTDAELESVFRALSYDNPEFFFLGNKCSFTSIGSFNYFMPQYIMDRESYLEKLEQVEKKATEILLGIKSDATDYEKELYLHDYITRNCDYASGGSQMIYTIYGLLVDGKANCEGYSRAMQYLLGKVGIENYLVTGMALNAQGEKEGHMWNIVEIDGEQFNLDATWDDYSIAGALMSVDNAPSHSYFNNTSEEMSATHDIDDDTMWEQCTSDENDYFENEGLRFDECNSAMESAVRRAIADSLMMGDCSLEVAFSNEEAYKQAGEYFIEENRLYTILRAVNEVVPSAYRVDSTQVQYSNDDEKLVLRLFFIK